MVDGDVIRALFAAFARRDVDAALDLVDERAEFWPEGTARRVEREGPYRGHAGIREYFADVATIWEELEVEPQSISAVVGGCTAFGVARGTPIGGEPVQAPVIWVFRLRAGRVVHGRVVTTAAEAAAAHAGATGSRHA